MKTQKFLNMISADFQTLTSSLELLKYCVDEIKSVSAPGAGRTPPVCMSGARNHVPQEIPVFS